MSKNTPKLPDLDPTVVSEVFTRRVAVLAMHGMSSTKIAAEMGLSKSAIEEIQKREDYKAYLKNVGEQEMNVAVIRAKGKMAGSLDKAFKVYEKAMDDYLAGKGGARDAVNVANSIHSATGVNEIQTAKQDTSITVVLPGGKDVITFDAETGDETT